MAQALAGQPLAFEWTHRRLDGCSLFEAEVSLVRLELPESTFLLALVRDVSQRKQAEGPCS